MGHAKADLDRIEALLIKDFPKSQYEYWTEKRLPIAGGHIEPDFTIKDPITGYLVCIEIGDVSRVKYWITYPSIATGHKIQELRWYNHDGTLFDQRVFDWWASTKEDPRQLHDLFGPIDPKLITGVVVYYNPCIRPQAPRFEIYSTDGKAASVLGGEDLQRHFYSPGYYVEHGARYILLLETELEQDGRKWGLHNKSGLLRLPMGTHEWNTPIPRRYTRKDPAHIELTKEDGSVASVVVPA